jgi:hypothetical protein
MYNSRYFMKLTRRKFKKIKPVYEGNGGFDGWSG